MTWKNFFSPSLKIAGGRALLWGLAGLAVSVAAASFSGWHAHGLLHFGPAPRAAWWISAVEYLVIWLVPSAIFYGMGAAMSRSRVRAVDIFGTVLFSQLPLAAMNLMSLLSPKGAGAVGSVDPATGAVQPTAVFASPLFILFIFVTVILVVLMVIWLFNAVKVSCNLKGGRLWAVYLTGVILGDVVCRILIGLMY